MSDELNVTTPTVTESVAPIATPETTATPTTTQENTTPSVETFKVKYNHEEKEIPVEEARELAQKGMHYDKAIEKAKSEAHQAARDAYIAEQGYEWNGKPITTEADYKQALKEQEIYQKLQAQSLPEEVIQEIIEGRKFREELTQEKQTVAQRQKQEAEYKEFFDYFAAENGRSFDPAKDSIPEEVWLATNKGKTLLDAYQANEAKAYKAKIKELEAQINTNKVNEANASTSTGSVTGQGTGTDFISAETFSANKHDQGWIQRNYNKIMSSRAKW
jgi:predicted Zn-dependent protease